jgi:hypothetical protein
MFPSRSLGTRTEATHPLPPLDRGGKKENRIKIIFAFNSKIFIFALRIYVYI